LEERVAGLCELFAVITDASPGATGVLIACLDILSQPTAVP